MRRRTGTLVKRGSKYYARWKVGDKVYLRSTGMTNRREAMAEMQRMIEPFNTATEIDSLERIAMRIKGRTAELEKLEAEANPPPEIGSVKNKILHSPVWLAYMDSPNRPDSGEATLRQYESEWRRFVSWLGAKFPKTKYLHQVTEQHAEEYARNLNDAKLSASTFNQHLNFLKLLWNVLADRAQPSVNVWDGIARRKLNALSNRKKALTPLQFDALLQATGDDQDLSDLFLILAWTGQRLVDGVMLKWEAVDFLKGVITLAPQKTARRQGKVIAIPLFPIPRDVLTRREGGQPIKPSDYVFPDLAEVYEHDASALTKRISATFERAGIETTEKRNGRARAVTIYGAHSLRHLAVTAFSSAGMPAAMIKSITGHASDGMLEHYQQIGVAMAAEISTRMTATTLPTPGLLPSEANTIPPIQTLQTPAEAEERAIYLDRLLSELLTELTHDEKVHFIKTLKSELD